MQNLFSIPAGRWTLGFLALAIALAPFSGPALAEDLAPSGQDKQIAILISQIVPAAHLSKHPLDNTISERGLDLYLKSLDPKKIYFYQSDVDAFQQYETSLDEMLAKGDLTAAYQIFNTFLARVEQSSLWVQQYIVEEHDFSIEEELLVDKDLVTYAKDSATAQDRWRKQVKLDILAEKADRNATKKAAEEKGEEYIEVDSIEEKLARRYRTIQKRWQQIDSDDLLELFLTSMISSYDPHTSYMSPSTHQNFKIHMGLNLEGIGATLQSEDGYTIVKSLVPGGAADKQGELQPEDKIVAVAQADDEMIDIVNMKLDDVVSHIRGTPGTRVRLQVERRGAPSKVVEIIRAKIELTDSEAQSEVFEIGQKPDGTPYKVGVIELPSFYLDMDALSRGDRNYKSTTRDVRDILRRFKAEEVDGVVLDLSTNGGGSLPEAISLTGLFIEQGPVVQVKDSNGTVSAYRDKDRGEIEWDGPLVVVISRFSASASEILAGAIQDYHRGLIIGDHATHGKGTVQTLSDLGRSLFHNLPKLPELGALKITVQQFYRPNGDSTQKRGVESDIEIPSLTTHYAGTEKDLDYPIEFDHVDAAKFDRFPYVNQAIVDLLKEQHAKRIEQDDEFASLQHDIELYLEQKEKDSITLQEEKFFKEREELYADQQERETLEEMIENPGNIKRDFYLDEIMNITADYIQAIEDGGYEYKPSPSGILDLLF